MRLIVAVTLALAVFAITVSAVSKSKLSKITTRVAPLAFPFPALRPATPALAAADAGAVNPKKCAIGKTIANGSCAPNPLLAEQCTCTAQTCQKADTCADPAACSKVGVNYFYNPASRTHLDAWGASAPGTPGWSDPKFPEGATQAVKDMLINVAKLPAITDEKAKQAWCLDAAKAPTYFGAANAAIAKYPTKPGFFDTFQPEWDAPTKNPTWAPLTSTPNWDKLPVCFGFALDINDYMSQSITDKGAVKPEAGSWPACRRLHSPYWSEQLNLRLLDCAHRCWLNVSYIWTTDQESENRNKTPFFASVTGGELCYVNVQGTANKWRTPWNGVQRNAVNACSSK